MFVYAEGSKLQGIVIIEIHFNMEWWLLAKSPADCVIPLHKSADFSEFLSLTKQMWER